MEVRVLRDPPKQLYSCIFFFSSSVSTFPTSKYCRCRCHKKPMTWRGDTDVINAYCLFTFSPSFIRFCFSHLTVAARVDTLIQRLWEKGGLKAYLIDHSDLTFQIFILIAPNSSIMTNNNIITMDN